MSGPNAFSMRRAISGVSAALPCRRSESVARRTCKISAAGWRRAQLCGPQTKLKSGGPSTLKKLGAAMGAAGQGMETPRSTMRL